MEPDHWLAGGGLLLGFLFGAAAQRSRFCMVAAVSNLALMRDYRQVHAWLAALGVALVGTGLLEWGGWVVIAESVHRRPTLDWLGAVGGGLMFGYGSMLAGGCASRTLVRCAEGNLGSVATLLAFAVAGMATMFGVLDPLRGWLAGNALYLASGDSSIAAIAGLPQWAACLSLALLCLGGILFLGHAWDHPGLIGAGVLIGLAVVAGWWVTGVLGYDEFTERPPTSLAVAGPLARATAWVTMHQPTGSLFALLFIPGVLAGSLASTLLSRSFRWISPDGSRIGAYLGGGALMGVGAVLAGGCNLGQGITGVATTSAGSLLAASGILGGMLLGLWSMSRASG